eukprot:COSAG05_NODE_8232_length_724_cov_0.734400_1_plen_181_part_10
MILALRIKLTDCLVATGTGTGEEGGAANFRIARSQTMTGTKLARLAVELEPSTSVVVRYAAIGVMSVKTDDDDGATATGGGSVFKVTVGWDEPPLAVSPAINAWHDTPLGASGNPLHDDVYPPSTYDIVESMDSARRQLRAPFVRLWSDTSYVYDWPTGKDAAGEAKAAHPSCPLFTGHSK